MINQKNWFHHDHKSTGRCLAGACHRYVAALLGGFAIKPATLLENQTNKVEPLFSWTLKSKKLLQYLSHQMFAVRVWSIKYRRKEKLIAQFGGKLRDERFKPN